MALILGSDHNNEVLFEERKGVRKIILNRPKQLNCLGREMVSQMLRTLGDYEKDPGIRVLILKGNGKAFCAGGDIKAMANFATLGHWNFVASHYRNVLTLAYMLGTYKKPVVSILDGIVMGAGAGLTMHTPFRIVTENTVFSMPEASWGHFPDCSASHFLSRLPGFFGEYLGLTGARLDGTEMLSCGLATHFVPSMDLDSMEVALERLIASGHVDTSNIFKTINKFAREVDLREDSACARLEIISKYFSAGTVEEIFSALETLGADNEEKWMVDAIKSMKSSSPTSLKLFLRLIREGRSQNLQKCLVSDFRAFCHTAWRTVGNDYLEGCRAILFAKDGNPKWMPSKLELVSSEMVERYFSEVDDDDDDWKPLQLPARSSPVMSLYQNSKELFLAKCGSITYFISNNFKIVIIKNKNEDVIIL